MIQEQYVSFETAKLLKEKGFNEPCICYSYGEGMNNYFSKPRIINNSNKDASYILFPTQQMTMKWLRKNYDLVIYPRLVETSDIEHLAWVYTIYNIFSQESNKSTILYTEYEQACEAAIKYCLENLI